MTARGAPVSRRWRLVTPMGSSTSAVLRYRFAPFRVQPFANEGLTDPVPGLPSRHSPRRVELLICILLGCFPERNAFFRQYGKMRAIVIACKCMAWLDLSRFDLSDVPDAELWREINRRRALLPRSRAGRLPRPTVCARCGETCPSARLARCHCARKRQNTGYT